MAFIGKDKQKSSESGNPIIDVTANMQGTLVFQEPVALRISGRFDGTLEAKGNLTIGERAIVQADITGEEITVMGRVNGKMIAKKSVQLIHTAVLTGEVWTPVLQVEPGARLDGILHMTDEKDWMKPEEVAEYLEVESGLVEQWAREGKIPALQKGGEWRFEKGKIDAWVAAQKNS